MADEREIELDEYCSQLASTHSVSRQLRILQHCRSHPFQWWVWDMKRTLLPMFKWRAPHE